MSQINWFLRGPMRNLIGPAWRQILDISTTQTSDICHYFTSLVTSKRNKMPGEGFDCTAPKRRFEDDTKEEDKVTLRFAKLTENAFTPTRGSGLAAGYDLYSAYEYVVPARGKAVALTDIQIALPNGCYGRVAPRSGLAAKHFIDVGAGVVDQDYRGNVGVVLFNFGSDEFKVNKGDRIAQLILERIFTPELQELPTLDTTERGSGGFGSTGVNSSNQ